MLLLGGHGKAFFFRRSRNWVNLHSANWLDPAIWIGLDCASRVYARRDARREPLINYWGFTETLEWLIWVGPVESSEIRSGTSQEAVIVGLLVACHSATSCPVISRLSVVAWVTAVPEATSSLAAFQRNAWPGTRLFSYSLDTPIRFSNFVDKVIPSS